MGRDSVPNAILADANADDFSGYADLINAAGPITIDASNGLSRFDQELTWSNFLPLITQPITFIGSRFDDSFAGTAQDDVIDIGASSSDGDRIAASLGDDRIIFDLPDDNQIPGYYLDYDSIGNGMTFEIDGVANAVSAYLGIEGTSNDDTFDIRLSQDQVYSFIGGQGADTYILDGDGSRPIFDFFFSNATSGIDLNLDTGVIANDGFGFEETIDITGTPTVLIVLATDENDRVTDGAGDQLIRLYDGNDVFEAGNLGNDSIDGGNGNDTVILSGQTLGQTTISFDGALTTVTDRANAEGTTAMLAVELLETDGAAPLELSKHDGIGLISAADLTTLTELYIAYFGRAADALGLSFWATAFQKNGFSLRDIADQFFSQPETQALYSGITEGDFVQAVYNNVLGRDADDLGFTFWTGQLTSGNVSESGFILELLAGARAATGDPADVAYIEDKTDIGLYFAVTQGQNNVDEARTVMDLFDGTTDSVAAAIEASDTAYQAALASNDELLMPVVGIIASPFIDVA